MPPRFRVSAVKTSSESNLGTVARIVRDFDGRLPILRVETWKDHLSASPEMRLFRAGARVFSAFAGIALVLAVVGVYGVKS
jgi:hypothetical protein